MALTKDFRETVWARAQTDVQFRRELLTGAINEFLHGDVEVGKTILRDYINATISYSTLAERLHKNAKSIQRMLGPSGNPTSESLFSIIKELQLAEGIQLNVAWVKQTP